MRLCEDLAHLRDFLFKVPSGILDDAVRIDPEKTDPQLSGGLGRVLEILRHGRDWYALLSLLEVVARGFEVVSLRGWRAPAVTEAYVEALFAFGVDQTRLLLSRWWSDVDDSCR